MTPHQQSRATIHAPATFGQRLADETAKLIGSWPFLIAQAIFLAAWVIVNTAHLFLPHFDPPPYMGLNLMLSFQAAFTGPVLLIAANRAAARDKRRDDVEAREVHLMTRQLGLLETINRQQTVMLAALIIGPLLVAAAFLLRRRTYGRTRH